MNPSFRALSPLYIFTLLLVEAYIKTCVPEHTEARARRHCFETMSRTRTENENPAWPGKSWTGRHDCQGQKRAQGPKAPKNTRGVR